MGCCGNEITEKNKNIPFNSIKKEEKNKGPINPTKVPVTSAGNEPQTPVAQNLNTNNNYSQNPTKDLNTLQISNKVNLIENKKDNLEKLLKEKPKNCYCYNDEEYLEIIDLLNKKNFDKDSMIYYKANYEVEDYIIMLKEYITIKTKKEEGKAYNSSFEYTNDSVSSYNLGTLNYVKLNRQNFQNYYLTETNINLKFVFNYNLLENDDPIITFEIDSMLKTKVTLFITFITFKFFYQCNYRLYFKNESSFDFYSLDDRPWGKNELSNLSPQEILFKGKNVQQYSFFIFKNKEYLSLNKKDPAFYCYGQTEMANLEKAVNSIKISCHGICIFSYKDYYTIQPSYTCIVKSYITFLCINNPEGLYYSFDHYLPEKTNLKLISIKFNGKECEKSYCSVSKNGLELSFSVPAKQYFGTLELDYSFSIRLANERKCIIFIDSKNLCFGGYFQLFVSIKDDLYYSNYLERKGKDFEKNGNEITWRTFHDDPNPRKYFNKLFLLISKINQKK